MFGFFERRRMMKDYKLMMKEHRRTPEEEAELTRAEAELTAAFAMRRPTEDLDDISLDIDDGPVLNPNAFRSDNSEEMQIANQREPEQPEGDPEGDQIAMTAAQRAIEDINAEEIRRGHPYTAEERQVLLHATAKKYVLEWFARKDMANLVRDLNDAISNQMDGLDEGLQEISAKLDEPRDAVGRAVKFQQEHPFLAGVLGASIVHRLKK